MSMSRKDFEAIAEAFKITELDFPGAQVPLTLAAHRMADHFKKVNPRFSLDAFIKACDPQ